MSTTKPIRVTAVHHGGGIGGAPISLLAMLQRLDAAAFASLAVFTKNGPILDEAMARGVPARVVPTGGAFFYSAHARLEPRTLARFVRTFPAAVRTARAWLRAQQPDVLHLNTSVLLAWGAAARREQVPVLWTVREVLGPSPVVRRWHAGFILRHARQVVGISSAVRACFPPNARVDVVYNAVDPQEFSPDVRSERTVARRELGLLSQERAVLALGSVQRAKGHWLLLDSLAILQARRSDVRLVLAAGGVGAEYAASLRGRVKRATGLPLDNLDALQRDAAARGLADRLLVTGFRRDVPRLLAAADVLVFPSLEAEGFGRPIIEAMASGCPVVATDVGPSAELLGPGGGWLSPPDALALANTLDHVLNDTSETARRTQLARQRVERLFSLDEQVRRFSALYQRVARG